MSSKTEGMTPAQRILTDPRPAAVVLKEDFGKRTGGRAKAAPRVLRYILGLRDDGTVRTSWEGTEGGGPCPYGRPVRELVRFTRTDFRGRIEHVGQGTVNVLEEVLGEYGLWLGMTEAEILKILGGEEESA